MSEAIADLRVRAQAGDRAALTALGKRLLFAEGVYPAPQEGIAHLQEAAGRGGGEALALLARIAAWGALRPRNVKLALDLLERSAECGWAPARAELRFLARSDGDEWKSLRHAVDIDSWLDAPPPRAALERPRLRVFDGFAAPEECNWIIERLRGDLQRAQVYQQGSAEPVTAETRTNSEAGLMLKSSDVAMCFIRDRIAAALKVAPEFCEVTKLLHYRPGQMFSLHSDFFEAKTPTMRQEIERRGQRFATFLLYLNDDYAGGETEFPEADFRYKGKRGDALLFLNVDPSGAPDYMSLHAGLPPTSGEKWILSQWIASKPINAFMTPGPAPAPLGLEWLRSI